MKFPHSFLGLGCLSLVLCFPVVSQAAPPNPQSPPPQSRHRGPPPEAMAACAGKTAGQTAQFTGPNGEVITGKCQMVLIPDHPPQPGSDGRRGPPEEAYAACKGKKSGEKSQFTAPDGKTITGTCETEGDKTVLRPDHPPRVRGEDEQPPSENRPGE